MKIYLVVEEENDGVEVYCACSTKEKAQEVLGMFNKGNYLSIAEFEVDRYPKIPKGHSVFEVCLKENGKVNYASKADIFLLFEGVEDVPWAEPDPTDWNCTCDKWIFFFLETALSRKEAIAQAKKNFEYLRTLKRLESLKQDYFDKHPFLKKKLSNA